MERKRHWESIYIRRDERDVSWFESVPALSMQMIEAAGLTPST